MLLGRETAPATGAWLACRLETTPGAPIPGGSAEGYLLRVSQGQRGAPSVTVTGPSHAGLDNGLRTLAQLLRQFGDAIPCVVITDAPVFATRGVMLDVSRDRVPTMEELLRVADDLAALKFNHLQLYTEHTFAYTGHDEVWQGWSPITPDEVRRLDEHCRSRGIILAANQNCFGHLASWLKHPRYMPLAEIQGLETEWQFYQWKRQGPFSLCPTDPGSIALVEDLLSQLLPCFSSGLVNINCDETADVGQGRSRGAAESHGRAPVYFEFVTKVAEAVRRHRFRPMFWADIALSHPEAIHLIPPDLLSLAWGYEPDSPFDKWCSLLREAGREAWVCPGTSSWRSITGRTRERRANIQAAANAGVAHGATGLLACDWGDLGHRQQWPVQMNALALAAEAAWNGTTDGYDPRATAQQLFGDRSLAAATWLDELGDADADLRAIAGPPGPNGSPTPLRNASVLFTDLHEPLAGAPRVGSTEQWRTVLDRLDDLASSMPAGLVDFVADELTHTLDVARLAARRALLRRRGLDGRTEEARSLAEELRRIIAEHRRLWLRRSRPGGLEHSVSYYQATLDELNTSTS